MDELEKLKRQWLDEYAQSQSRFYDDIQQIKHDVDMATKIYPSVAIPSVGYDINIDAAVIDGSAVFPNEDEMIKSGLRLAGPNQLNIMEKLDIESFNMIGEENYKTKVKRDMSMQIATEITAKTKFTLLKEHDQVTTRAKVYAFNEAELTAFIEKILKIAK